MNSNGPVGGAVDVHGHCVPQAFLDEVVRSAPFGVQAEAADGKYYLTFPGQKRLRPIAGVMLDTADRGPWFAEQEVAHQIVAPWLDIHGQELPAADGARWVRLLNEAVAESVSDRARRLSGHATLHLADADAAAEELRRAVRELGLRSAMIPASLPSGRPLRAALRRAVGGGGRTRRTGAAAPGDQRTRQRPAGAVPNAERAVRPSDDATLTTAELVVAGVFDRFPALRLVVVHGGGFLPYQVGRFDRDVKGGGDSRRLPSDVARSLYYDTVLMSAAAVRFLLDSAGPEQVLIGSDFGAAQAERAGVRLTAATREATADPATLQAVLDGNATRLFRIG